MSNIDPDANEIHTDEEIADFLQNTLGLSDDELNEYLEKEQFYITQGSLAPDIFPNPEEIKRVFQIMRNIVEGRKVSSDPISDYDRAMGIF